MLHATAKILLIFWMLIFLKKREKNDFHTMGYEFCNFFEILELYTRIFCVRQNQDICKSYLLHKHSGERV